MRILDLAFKDVFQLVRDRRTLIFLVVMPIAFTLFMGFAYQRGGNDQTATDNRIPLGWVNNDPEGLLSNHLFATLLDSDSIKLVEFQSQTATDEDVRKGEVAGALLVPQGFSTSPSGSVQQLTLVVDTTSTNGQSLFQLLRSPVTQLFSSVEIARLSAEAVNKPGDAAEYEHAFLAATQAWEEIDSNSLVDMEMAVAEPEQIWYGDNPYNQASPGILVQFAIFGLVTSGQILVQERKSRTLQRMMTTSLRPWEIVAGHTLAMFVVVFVQEALLVVFGQFALGVNYGRVPFGILAVLVALGLWIAAMGLLIGILARDDSQVVLFSLMAMFLFSALGGTWFPLETTSGVFAEIGKVMPSAWAMNGLQNILIRGLDSSSTWQPTSILVAYAAGFFVLAVWRFRKMEI